MRLGLVDDDLFLEHAAPSGHPEREDRLRAVRRGISHSGVPFERQDPVDATRDQLLRVHSEGQIDFLQSIAGNAGHIDADTYYSPDTWAANLRASGGVVRLVQGLVEGQIDYGFAATRPPGHHATRDRSMGFCLVNHAAVAAAEAKQLGVERILILDWDVHHGNGTEDIFYSDPQVLYVSLHQSPQYPGTGSVSDVGRDAGTGFNLNVPLSSGAGDAVYCACFRDVVCPAVADFRPELTIVSAGFDAHQLDPLGGMQLTDAGFAQMTELLLGQLPNRGQGATLLILEGGYDLKALEGATDAVLSTLQRSQPPRDSVQDGATQDAAANTEEELAPHFAREIARAKDSWRRHHPA